MEGFFLELWSSVDAPLRVSDQMFASVCTSETLTGFWVQRLSSLAALAWSCNPNPWRSLLASGSVNLEIDPAFRANTGPARWAGRSPECPRAAHPPQGAVTKGHCYTSHTCVTLLMMSVKLWEKSLYCGHTTATTVSFFLFRKQQFIYIYIYLTQILTQGYSLAEFYAFFSCSVSS